MGGVKCLEFRRQIVPNSFGMNAGDGTREFPLSQPWPDHAPADPLPEVSTTVSVFATHNGEQHVGV